MAAELTSTKLNAENHLLLVTPTAYFCAVELLQKDNSDAVDSIGSTPSQTAL